MALSMPYHSFASTEGRHTIVPVMSAICWWPSPATCGRGSGQLSPLWQSAGFVAQVSAAASAGLCLTSIIMLLCANFLPFLAINAGGLANSMTLFQAASVLFDEDYRILSVIVYLHAVAACLLSAAGLLSLWRLSLSAPSAPFTPRAGLPLALQVAALEHGGGVSGRCAGELIKIASTAEVSIGNGFWCFVVFCLMFIKSVVHLDKTGCGDLIRAASSATPHAGGGGGAGAGGHPCHGCQPCCRYNCTSAHAVVTPFIHVLRRAYSAVSPCPLAACALSTRQSTAHHGDRNPG